MIPKKTQLDKIPSSLMGGLCEVNLLRLDLFEPEIPGNKYFKMKYNIEEMLSKGFDHLVTFGGAYSNHIAACAQAGKKYGFKTTGIIRGESWSSRNATLTLAKQNGMNFKFIDRNTYRDWKYGKVDLDEYLGESKYYLLPEGGSNTLAVKGCAEILQNVSDEFQIIACGVGTGSTLSGLISGSNVEQKILGFSSMKGGEYIEDDIRTLLEEYDKEFNFNSSGKKNWQVNHKYHFGGFAKANDELIHFYKDFYLKTGIELDLIYTCKMMYGLRDMIRNEAFKLGTKILAVHTGGQQGNESMLARFE